MAAWKVTEALHSPKNITVGSKRPKGVLKLLQVLKLGVLSSASQGIHRMPQSLLALCSLLGGSRGITCTTDSPLVLL